MRQIIDPKMLFGEHDISAIKLDQHSLDDIPQILRGLQLIYITSEARKQVPGASSSLGKVVMPPSAFSSNDRL